MDLWPILIFSFEPLKLHEYLLHSFLWDIIFLNATMNIYNNNNNNEMNERRQTTYNEERHGDN
ncbi:hypothetical protein DERF_004908 [Dermatophagoides farinae]|uniref:Uncharacterized protein n=1 Tax=Dermatophagoides farinae TaxID=6954 RepID=A0A922I739_DERFA|nr:hypothetical protein DERF_004908 [Dermatophagoides farinae]